jgi:quercetin dioxygenase-like cupin family protein
VQATDGASFGRSQPGYFVDWHNALRRQLVITLAGEVEIGLGDGTKQRFGPGDVLLAEDLTGHGHTTRVVSDAPRITLTVPLA